LTTHPFFDSSLRIIAMASSGDWPLTEWEYGSGFTEGLDEEIKGMDELKLSHRLTKVCLSSTRS